MEFNVLKRKLVIYASLALILMGIAIGLSAFVPFYLFVDRTELARHEKESVAFGKVIEQELKRFVDVSNQISTRTRVREILEDWNQGIIERKEMEAGIAPKLGDALSATEGLLGISQYDQNGMLTVQVGEKIKIDKLEKLLPSNGFDFKLHEEVGVQSSEHDHDLLIGVPIVNRRGIVVGVEYMLFSFSLIEKVLQTLISFDPNSKTFLIMQEVHGFHLVNRDSRTLDISEDLMAMLFHSHPDKKSHVASPFFYSFYHLEDLPWLLGHQTPLGRAKNLVIQRIFPTLASVPSCSASSSSSCCSCYTPLPEPWPSVRVNSRTSSEKKPMRFERFST